MCVCVFGGLCFCVFVCGRVAMHNSNSKCFCNAWPATKMLDHIFRLQSQTWRALQSCRTLGEFGKALEKFEELRTVLDSFGEFWRALENSGELWRALEQGPFADTTHVVLIIS